MKQASTLDLFTYPQSPGHRGVETQIEAAKQIEPRLGYLQAVVLNHVRRCGARGATRQEIADATGLKLQTVCGRTRELVLAQKLIDTDDRRQGRNVCVAVENVA